MNHRRILLIIENENSTQELTQLCLEVAGWEVLTIDLVSEAIFKAATKQVDAILLDLNEIISDIDWQTILLQLHNNTTTRQIPVILLTSTEQYKDLPKLTELGTTKAIIKPFDLLTLASQVTTVLGWEY